jgi:hypothetical protein
VRLVFADGREIDAAVHRGHHGRDVIVESVHGSAGGADLRAPLRSGTDPNAAAMRDLIAAVRAGRLITTGETLCRASLAAVLGRQAAETGATIPWPTGFRQGSGPARPLQSV